MLKKTLTYTDYNDETQTEDFYFNLTRAELIQMELSGAGNSFTSQIQNIIKANNGAMIIRTLDDILHKAYGVRSEDGKRFIKNEQVWSEFVSSAAYGVLFEQLATDAGAASAFINGITAGIAPEATPQTTDATATPSDIARARSEASLQGHNAPKKPEHQASEIIDVVEEPPVTAQTPKLTREQLEAQLAALND